AEKASALDATASGGDLAADRGAQHVDGRQPLVGLEVPVGPAVAGRLRLHHGAYLVDRAGKVAHHQAAVGADAGGVAALVVVEHVAGPKQARLDDLAEG